MITDGKSAPNLVTSFLPNTSVTRQPAAHYDTPSIGPVSVSASVQNHLANDTAWSSRTSSNGERLAAASLGKTPR